MRFVFVSFLFLVDNFDLSVSSATRKRADQPIRPSACARQCPWEQSVPRRAFTRNRTLVVLLRPTRCPFSDKNVARRDAKIFRNRSKSVPVQRRDSVRGCSRFAVRSAGVLELHFACVAHRATATTAQRKVCPRNTLKSTKEFS
jgi:hypothetical protein